MFGMMLPWLGVSRPTTRASRHIPRIEFKSEDTEFQLHQSGFRVLQGPLPKAAQSQFPNKFSDHRADCFFPVHCLALHRDNFLIVRDRKGEDGQRKMSVDLKPFSPHALSQYASSVLL